MEWNRPRPPTRMQLHFTWRRQKPPSKTRTVQMMSRRADCSIVQERLPLHRSFSGARPTAQTPRTMPLFTVAAQSANYIASSASVRCFSPSTLRIAPAQCFFAALAALRAATSPSASHVLAFFNCTTLMICFPNMTGKETAARIQGIVLSILFALHV